MGKVIAIIGASGGIGEAFVHHYVKDNTVERIYAFSRSNVSFEDTKVISNVIDITDERSIERAAQFIDGQLDNIIVATGLLHDQEVTPEKSLKDVSLEKFQDVFAINTFGPALVAKYFCSLMPVDRLCLFAVLSARVGSISDNYLGGWYAYRASKAALNMIIKNISIEVTRKNKQACIIGLHPGTTDTDLSKPFQSYVQEEKLFTPRYSVSCMTKIIEEVSPDKSGKVIAWDGKEIEP